MPLAPPLNLFQWLKDNARLLQPPVNNFCLYSGADFIVMAVGGPNARADYHVNETEVFEASWKIVGRYLIRHPLPNRSGSISTRETCSFVS